METRKNRADPERFFPKGENSLEGALKKMNYLKQNTEILVQVPLKLQIYNHMKTNPLGITVQEISLKLGLNTKTCSKILDEMIYKYPDIKSTAHRYGRVFVHKYHVATSLTDNVIDNKDLKELMSDANQDIIQEINDIEKDVGAVVKEAISQSLKKEKKHNRQRITHQSYIRALFVVSRIRKLKVCSVFDIKEMIRNELEPNAKWCLDKKTVLRLIWKLRNCGLIKELCFKIKLRKDDDHEVSFLGYHYNCILEDKLNNKNNSVIYKLLAALPDISHTDPLVTLCPAIKNPTNRKPFTPTNSTAPKSSINIKSKTLKDIVLIQSNAYKKLKNTSGAEEVFESIIKMEDLIEGKDPDPVTAQNAENMRKGYSLAIFTKAIFILLSQALSNRCKILFTTFRMPLCYTALKEIFNNDNKITWEKYSLAYENFSFDRKAVKNEPIRNDIEILIPLNLPKKRKYSLKDMSYQIKKVLVSLERKPGLVDDDSVKKLAKGLDTDTVRMMNYLSDLGYVHKKNGYWELKRNSYYHFLY